MGQIEVYNLLKERRLAKDNRFFSASEVIKLLKEKGYSNGLLNGVRGDLLCLEISGYLDVQMSGKIRDWKRLFRLKYKYCLE